jgi:hypothetical protein
MAGLPQSFAFPRCLAGGQLWLMLALLLSSSLVQLFVKLLLPTPVVPLFQLGILKLWREPGRRVQSPSASSFHPVFGRSLDNHNQLLASSFFPAAYRGWR